MRDIVEAVAAWIGAGERVAIATVVDVKRSAPRPPGAKMAVTAAGDVSGAVSGGCVEGAVIEAAVEVLREGSPERLHFGIADSDAWDVGLPCGGEITIFVEEFRLPAQAEFARIAADRGRAAVVTVVEGPGLGNKLLVREDGTHAGALGGAELDEAGAEAAWELMWAERSEMREHGHAKLFVDATYPPPKLVVFGAVDYTAALCRLARAAGWRPYVCDPRTRFATRARFPEAEMVVAAWPAGAFEAIGGIDGATFIAVLTHDPKLDDAALTIALRSDAAYVGAMGSHRAQEQRRERLLATGLEAELIDRLAAPIGLDLGALGPEETALSIMAEIVAVRRDRGGGRLRDQQGGRIHEVGS